LTKPAQKVLAATIDQVADDDGSLSGADATKKRADDSSFDKF